MMQEFDFLIAGGGGAGLGLAYALSNGLSPRKPSILIVDREAKNQNDRTWCFWGPPEAPFTQIAAHSWQKLRVVSEEFDKCFELQSERYWMVRGIDYYEFIRENLDRSPAVQFKHGSISAIEEAGDRALILLNGETVVVRWAFDSTFTPNELKIDTRRYHALLQHFKGWEIETPQDCFDPETAVLFDFRTPQHNDMRFFYVLPFSARRALVEYTVFSAQMLTPGEYETALKHYLTGVLGISAYTLQSEETGVIPMTDQPFPRRAGRRTLNIGTKGGRVKPSTGYAFARMQRDALAITRSLQNTGEPFALPKPPARYRLYDSILLQIVYRHGDLMKPIFVQLFKKNPIQRIFHFLDESGSIWEDAALIASLPPLPFLRALLKLLVLRRI
jgi:lycopene beta-cyclase